MLHWVFRVTVDHERSAVDSSLSRELFSRVHPSDHEPWEVDLSEVERCTDQHLEHGTIDAKHPTSLIFYHERLPGAECGNDFWSLDATSLTVRLTNKSFNTSSFDALFSSRVAMEMLRMRDAASERCVARLQVGRDKSKIGRAPGTLFSFHRSRKGKVPV